MIYLKNVVTLEYEEDKFTGCGRCEEACPHRVFLLRDKKAVLGNKDACMECGACARNCAFNAIRVRPGVGCAWAILLSRIRKTEVCCGE